MYTSAEKQRLHALRNVFTYPERDPMSEDDNRTLFAETVSLLFNEIKNRYNIQERLSPIDANINTQNNT